MRVTIARAASISLSLSLLVACAGAPTPPSTTHVERAAAGEESTDEAQVAADIVPVEASLSGVIAKVHVRENQRVQKGDVLAELDNGDYSAREMQAEAELAAAFAEAAAADAQVQILEAKLKGGIAAAGGSSSGVVVPPPVDSQAALQRAELEATKAKIDLGRASTLRRAKAIAQRTLDSAQATYDGAQAAVLHERARLAFVTDAKDHPGQDVQALTLRAQADLAHARVDAAKAKLDLAKLRLSHTKVYAPSEGFASKVAVHPGQLVDVGQPIVEIVPTSTCVIASFKETQVASMRPGQRAQITLDSLPGRKFEGKVESLSLRTEASVSRPMESTTGNFVKSVQRVTVRISWVNVPTDVTMRAGLSAAVTVKVGS